MQKTRMMFVVFVLFFLFIGLSNVRTTSATIVENNGGSNDHLANDYHFHIQQRSKRGFYATCFSNCMGGTSLRDYTKKKKCRKQCGRH